MKSNSVNSRLPNRRIDVEGAWNNGEAYMTFRVYSPDGNHSYAALFQPNGIRFNVDEAEVWDPKYH